ncbi:hypothetical protein NPIL_9761 [Nephila pilipes]|uniref:Uncharacterized protein n=1 Tax=Nephila pilipes TaxID=299642 RepID=A0A8X6UD16_NEPPI|nr:hypothetical protein NPIL_9761 [Nephila pilipes]
MKENQKRDIIAIIIIQSRYFYPISFQTSPGLKRSKLHGSNPISMGISNTQSQDYKSLATRGTSTTYLLLSMCRPHRWYPILLILVSSAHSPSSYRTPPCPKGGVGRILLGDA